VIGPLDSDVGISDTAVVTQNTVVDDPFTALAPPAPASGPLTPTPVLADAAALRAMTEAQLVDEILARIAAAEQRPLAEVAAEPKHADGSVKVDSMTAVSALASIGGAVGKKKLVDLSAVDTEDLHSVLGLARIARKALDNLSTAKATS